MPMALCLWPYVYDPMHLAIPMGPFKCYVMPGGLGGCVIQRCVALQGGGGGGGGVLVLVLRNACIYFTR